ncbi:MAG: hypothetical protein K2O45_14775 [Oscillospiraceae bacterium]|nr:hypothetical protein [Oscillospiraceae bacterium]
MIISILHFPFDKWLFVCLRHSPDTAASSCLLPDEHEKAAALILKAAAFLQKYTAIQRPFSFAVI